MGQSFSLFNNISLSRSSNKNCSQEHNIFNLTREVVCYNQGKIAEYYFMHEKYIYGLMEKLYQFEKDPDSEIYRTELVSIYEEYNLATARELTAIVQHNLGFASDYFQDRRKKNVRPCIKLLSHELDIVDPFRKNSKKYNYKKNTGFQRLVENTAKKSNFLCQNIPESVAAGSYKNIRIDVKCMSSYYEREGKSNRIVKYFKDKLRNSDLHIEKDWFDCWKGYTKETPSVEDCYKSTLIIPMTFGNNSLSQDFQDYISQHQETENGNLLGFLCFDHSEINYFDEEKDINFGYKIADLVSLYVLKEFISKNSKQYLYIEHIVGLIKNNKIKELEILSKDIKEIKQ